MFSHVRSIALLSGLRIRISIRAVKLIKGKGKMRRT